MDELSKTAQLLLDCLKKNPDCPRRSTVCSLDPSDWNQLLDLAAIQRVRPLLHHRLKAKHLDHLVPEAAKTALQNAYRETTLRNLHSYGELHHLGVTLDRANIPLLVLKGMFLAEAAYGNIGLREMEDIDLLVHPQHLPRIVEQLSTFGYDPATPIYNIDPVLNTQHHLPRFTKAYTAGFEIHWNLTQPDEIYTIDPAELWRRAVPVRLKGLDFLTLCPEDMLLHLCWHTSYQHQFAFGLRPSCDIAELLASCNGDLAWASVLDRAERWGWRRGVYLALRLAEELVDADISDEVMKNLRPTDLDEGIVTVARSQVFTDPRFANTVSRRFAQLIGANGLWGRVKIFGKRVFLTRSRMASMYPAAPDSLKIYCYYAVRVFDLLRRYGRNMCKVLDSDSGIIELAKRKRTIARFLLEG